MTDHNLSPQAQAIWDAWWNANNKYAIQDLGVVVRAAADQVVPEHANPVGDEHDDARHEQWMRIRAELLAIADELDGDGPAVFTDREPASVVPEPTDKELCETYVAAYYAAKNRQGPAAQAAGLRAVLQKWGAL